MTAEPSSPLCVHGFVSVTRYRGSESVACVTFPCSPWSRPLAPPTPPLLSQQQFCSQASQLLWPSLTSRVRASSATAPRLPDAGQPITTGQTRDLPVPVQGACTHARVSDHAESPKHLRERTWSCCLLLSEQHQHPGLDSYRGSMAGLCVPLSTLHAVPHDTPCMTRGQYESLLLYCLGLSPVYSLPVFTGALTLNHTLVLPSQSPHCCRPCACQHPKQTRHGENGQIYQVHAGDPLGRCINLLQAQASSTKLSGDQHGYGMD